MSCVTPQQLEDKRLLVDTLSDAIDQLEWAQDVIPSPSIDSALASIRFVRDRLAGEAKLAEQFLRPSASTLTRNERK
jgi:hypothetical protein